MNNPILKEALNVEFLKRVESGEITEDLSIEFKEKEYDLSLRDSKKGMLRDICAMVNMRGGVIFLGVSDDGSLVGVSIEDLDSYKRQVLQTINTGIEPQITEVDFKIIDCDQIRVLCILIPSPSNKPYCYKVSQSGAREFLIRNDGINHHLSMSEIRRMFLGQNDLSDETWEQWRAEVVDKVCNDNWLKPLMEKKCLLVFVTPKKTSPSNSLTDTQKLKGLADKDMKIWPPHSNGRTLIPFENGVCALGRPQGDFGRDELCYSFVVAENNSSVYFYDGMPPFHRDKSCKIDPSIDAYLFKYAENASKFLEDAGFKGHRYELCLYILNAKDHKISVDSFLHAFPGAVSNAIGIQKDIFEILTEFTIGDDIKHISKSILDKLWQVSGFERCFHYDENGKYSKKLKRQIRNQNAFFRYIYK